MEETKMVLLSDKRKVVLEDDDDLILSLVFDDKAESIFEVPYPSGGYGGGRLKLSPSENYLIFSYFSGDSVFLKLRTVSQSWYMIPDICMERKPITALWMMRES